MKKFLFITLLVLIGVGGFVGYRMLKGEGGWRSCCGWGEDKDPWSTYTPPADEAAAGAGGAGRDPGAGGLSARRPPRVLCARPAVAVASPTSRGTDASPSRPKRSRPSCAGGRVCGTGRE